MENYYEDLEKLLRSPSTEEVNESVEKLCDIFDQPKANRKCKK